MSRRLRNKILYIKNKKGCHVCISHPLDDDGYPIVWVPPNSTIRLHRLIYMKYYGPIPQGMVVRHKCDNRLCINPEHLELGTPEDNVRDMVRRLRHARGTLKGGTKLTEEDVEEILLDTKTPTRVLAKKFGVSKMTIYHIRNGVTWKDHPARRRLQDSSAPPEPSDSYTTDPSRGEGAGTTLCEGQSS